MYLKNTYEQSHFTRLHPERGSSPPFGSDEYLLRTPPYLKQGYKRLEAFLFSPPYSNNTATAATALFPNYQWGKVDAEMKNRNRAKAPKSPILLVADERNKRYLLYSRFLMQRSTKADISKQRKSSSPFGMPKIFFESHHNSSEFTRGLRLFCLWGNMHLTGTRSLTLAPHSFQLLHIFPKQYSSD